MSRTTTVVALAGALVLGALVQGVRADDAIAGTYDLSGREKSGLAGFFGLGPKTTATLWVAPNEDGTYRVGRTSHYSKDGQAIGTMIGTGRLSGNVLEVTFPRTSGLTETLSTLGEARSEDPPFRARYTFRGDGRVEGWCEAPARNGKVRRFDEKGRRGQDQAWPSASGSTTSTGAAPTTPSEPTTPSTEPAPAEPTTPGVPDGPLGDDVRVERPGNGRVFLVGQAIPFSLFPADASLKIQGPARRDGQTLVITQPGQVTLTATHAGRTSRPVTIEAIKAEVVEVTVQDAVPIRDAPPPHFRRDPGTPADRARIEPAAILKDRPLALQVTLRGAKNLSEAATVRLTGKSGNLRYDAEVTVRDLAQGAAVRVESQGPLTDGVKVNQVDIAWKLADQDVGSSKLRVYTIYAQPVENPMPKYAPSVRPVELVTKLHLEMACTWANGATRNDGRGICFQIDNAFAHHVHPDDYRGTPPFVHAYAPGARKPRNYRDLPGAILSGGRRSPAQGLYYPPLEPDKDYEQYHHYARNFGWWVLDNPDYTGGRCNQQASLIADIFGTVGIRARVYYIERVGRGKLTGRPMRRYYKSSRSSQSWNFHGVTEAELEGGVKWLYDGSGSWPTRINGQTEELMRVPNGPFVDFWHPWSYEDTGGRVPPEDWPDTWEGVPLQPGEQYP